jgi:thiamine-phosphate pyrophosphorylase
MDQGLIARGRRVKRLSAPPPLWLFSDAARMPDLCALVRTLPPGLCGVVFRHDAAPDRARLGAALARLCRARRIALVVAGDAKLAARLKAGVHLRGGRGAKIRFLPRHALVSASVHDRAELRQARRAGAKLLFISPVFATSSHPGAAGLGGIGWQRLARSCAPAVPAALGGMNGRSARVLGKSCAHIGAIEGFLGKK